MKLNLIGVICSGIYIVFLTCSTVSSEVDICNLYNSSMYCTCDHYGYNSDLAVTCFIFGNLSSSDGVWKGFGNLQNLKSLTLTSRANCQLKFVPTVVLTASPSLQRIDIKEASLGEIDPYTFANLSSLTSLHLERSEISSLHRYSVVNLPSMVKLILSENSLTKLLANTFSNLPALEQLYLDRNNISYIEDCAFCNLHNLKELELWSNHIKSLSKGTFRGLRYLRRLDLYNCHLTRLGDKVFHSMPRLRELDLKQNEISEIGRHAFDNLGNLMSLQLNNNRIKFLLDHLFKGTPRLLLLDLSNNEMEVLQEAVVSDLEHGFVNLFVLYFKDNPLRCTCELLWIHKYMEQTESKSFRNELQRTKCYFNKTDEDRVHVLDLTKEELPCRPKTSTTTASPSSIAVFTSEVSKEKSFPAAIEQRPSSPHSVLKLDGMLNEDIIVGPEKSESVKLSKDSSEEDNSGCIAKNNMLLLFSLFVAISMLRDMWS